MIMIVDNDLQSTDEGEEGTENNELKRFRIDIIGMRK